MGLKKTFALLKGHLHVQRPLLLSVYAFLQYIGLP